MMKRIVPVISALVLAAGGPAVAADLPVNAPVADAVPSYNWTGFYVGLNAGAAFSRGDATTTTAFSSVGYLDPTGVTSVNASGSNRFNTTTFTGGVQAGYNWQADSIVFGVETDFNYFNPSGSTSAASVYPCCAPSAYAIAQSVSTSWQFTARPRLGFAANSWLLYATGGLAVTNVSTNWSFSDNFCPVFACGAGATESASASVTKAGWVLGGGVEAGLWGRWSAKAEYLYMDFGSVSATGTNLTVGTPSVAIPAQVFNHSMALKTQIVRAGINYRFGP
jgi:outer membrane immunogenic protein